MNKVEYVKWLYEQMREVEAQGQAKLFRVGYVAGAKEAYLTAIDKAKGLQITSQPDQRIIDKAVQKAEEKTVATMFEVVNTVMVDMGVDEADLLVFHFGMMQEAMNRMVEKDAD